jgi:DNA-binding Lrp family transcriptional regulator
LEPELSLTLDALNIKIIDGLRRNARSTTKELGERLATSDRTIARRIKTLEKMGIIRGYTVLLGPGAAQIEFRSRVDSDGERYSVSIEDWQSLLSSLQQMLGTGYLSLLFLSGRKLGQQLAETVANERDYQTALSMLHLVAQERGWGNLDVEVSPHFNQDGRAILETTHQSVITSNKDMCHWIRGILAGFLETALHTKVAVAESACRFTTHEFSINMREGKWRDE